MPADRTTSPGRGRDRSAQTAATLAAAAGTSSTTANLSAQDHQPPGFSIDELTRN